MRELSEQEHFWRDRYSDLQLLDYGFGYHRDRQFPVDDVNWFLLEKRP